MSVHDWSIHPYDDDTGPATAFDVTPPPAPTMSSFAEAPAGDAAKGTRATRRHAPSSDRATALDALDACAALESD